MARQARDLKDLKDLKGTPTDKAGVLFGPDEKVAFIGGRRLAACIGHPRCFRHWEERQKKDKGWNYRDISRYSNMERLKGFIENSRPNYTEYYQQGLPEVQDALTFANQSDTDLAKGILNSTVNDLPIEHVAANLWWKDKAKSATAVFKITTMGANPAPLTVATTCITVDPDWLPKQIKDAYKLRVSQHGFIGDLYSITSIPAINAPAS